MVKMKKTGPAGLAYTKGDIVKKLKEMIPPSDVEVEIALLGILLILAEDALELFEDILEIISAKDFYRDAHKIIFSAMTELYQNNKPFDLVSVSNYVKKQNNLDAIGGPAYLASLTDIIPMSSALISYAKIIKEKSVRRQVISSSANIASQGYDETISTKELLARWHREFDAISMDSTSLTKSALPTDLGSLLNSFSVTETHIRSLNNVIGGLPNDVTIILGQTSMGKTSLALGFLQKFLFEDNLPVAYFGPQIKPEEILFRLFASRSQIHERKIKRGNLTSEERGLLREIHQEFLSKEFTLNIFCMKDKRMCAMEIGEKVRKLHKKNGLDLVVIENLQQLVWPEKIVKRNEELKVISGYFKGLSNNLGIPIVISSQIHKDVNKRENKRPLPSDLSGTSEGENLARLILCLYRKEYYANDTSKEEWEEAEIRVFKYGPPTTINLKFNPSTFTWGDKE